MSNPMISYGPSRPSLRSPSQMRCTPSFCPNTKLKRLLSPAAALKTPCSWRHCKYLHSSHHARCIPGRTVEKGFLSGCSSLVPAKRLRHYPKRFHSSRFGVLHTSEFLSTLKKHSPLPCWLTKHFISVLRTFPLQPALGAPQSSVKYLMLRRFNGTRSRSQFFFTSLLPCFLVSLSLASCSHSSRGGPRLS